MSDASVYDQGLEKLLRWIFDKPIYQKPPIGKPPAFLIGAEKPSLGTTSRHRLVMDAFRQGKSTAPGLLKDYFETFAANMETLRIQPQQGKEFDDQVVESIEAFLPYRNEAVEIFLGLARHLPTAEGYNAVHSFLGMILPYSFRPEGQGAYVGWEQDNFKFIVYELFLYAVAALLKHERFEGVRELMEQEYFLPRRSSEIDSGMTPFIFFGQSLRSLGQRNMRLKLQRMSLTADFLKNRATLSELSFDDLMQADFVIFLWSDLHSLGDKFVRINWWPETLIYAGHHHGPFEIFARAQSEKYFNRLKVALGIGDKNALLELVEKYKAGKLDLPRLDFGRLNPSSLMNLEKLATRP
jgi:hypothetical protein